MSRTTTAFLSGLVFGAGLILAQMTNPAKVIGFLDVTGFWDPSLAFVMAGALIAFGIVYRWSKTRASPLQAAAFAEPTDTTITPQLVIGSLLFGIGWGLSGICPGPAIVTSTFLEPQAWAFVVTMILGMYLHALTTDSARALEPTRG